MNRIPLILCLALAACGAPRIECIDGELYTDVNGDGIFVRETHDLAGKTPVRCEVRR